jgi:signal transduction histidine kinase
MNPLSRIPSIKFKLGIVIVAGVVTTLVSMVIARRLGVYLRWGVLASGFLALVVIQLLARGMTAPLREMAAAAKAMARGEHGQKVEVRGNDEVAQLAEAFNAMSAEIAETDRMRRELVANASHELRTPISALQASLENMIDGVQSADQRALAALRAQVERLSSMVEQLLDLSRMEAEGAGLELAEFPVERLLARSREEAVLSVNGEAKARIEVDALPGDLRIVADEDRLRQVVTNLIDNAVRYSPPGEQVRASASIRGNLVRLDVVDHGPGIPEMERVRVFERFYRLDESRSNAGAGLGLSIAHSIVSLHGGTIRVETAEPRGCRMVVELPDAAARGRDA